MRKRTCSNHKLVKKKAVNQRKKRNFLDHRRKKVSQVLVKEAEFQLQNELPALDVEELKQNYTKAAEATLSLARVTDFRSKAKRKERQQKAKAAEQMCAQAKSKTKSA